MKRNSRQPPQLRTASSRASVSKTTLYHPGSSEATRHGTDVLVLVSVSNDLCLKASLARTTVALGTATPAAALQTPAVPSAQSRPRPNSSFFTEELFFSQ